MNLKTPISRFLFGLVCLLIILIAGFTWVGAVIPTWNSTPEEVNLVLPGDEIVSQSQLAWNHAITIQAAPKEVYPWLAQIGDTRGGFYSFTFIENLFMVAGGETDRYVNAREIHPEWQNTTGQGIIMNYMAIIDSQPDEYVLAAATPNMPGVQWTWLWYLRPVDVDTTRLIVRHRFLFPEEAPLPAIKAMLNAGYVMERGMLLGIRNHAEGNIPSPGTELLQAILWLAALACGGVAGARFIRRPHTFHPLGVGLEAVVVLFLYTLIQPAIWIRVLLILVLVGSLFIAKGTMERFSHFLPMRHPK